MRGFEELIAMRKRRFVPSMVWINTDSENTLPLASDWHEFDNTNTQLQTEPGDKARSLDMRCVIGLPCYVQGNVKAEVLAMRDACIKAKASRVIAAVMRQIGHGEWIAFQVDECSDTQGHLTHAPATAQELEAAYG